ncbi:MarR family winged helix-turn-helix transcriptional regulator [Kibdelosporangium lantanae]|uniref:MarR family winged helix-turn-helix transcriptional regulator n=1 Tax=Kibdelosporangium lantanae TaxID=1497396 RepID=A0ABW3MEI1_9PSEU
MDTQFDSDVCQLVHRLAHKLDAHVRKVGDDLGITATQVIVLRELTGAITARELATKMFCEPSNVTFVLDRLEKQGLVERRPHPTDRRAKQIVLTPEGKKYRANVLKHLRRDYPLADLDENQRSTLHELLRSLNKVD